MFDSASPSSIGEKAVDNPRRMHEAVAALLQQYGMFGRAWDKLGRDAVLLACEFLSDYNNLPNHPIVASEGVAEFIEDLANITLGPLRKITQTRDPFSVSDTLSSMPLIGNGVCSQLMRGDRSGVRRL